MTTQITIKNTGSHPVNVNESESIEPHIQDRWRIVMSHELKPGEEITLHIWRWHDVTVVEQCSGE